MQTVASPRLLSDLVILPKKESTVVLDDDRQIVDFFTSLADKGLDCLTDFRIEHIISTTALAGFF